MTFTMVIFRKITYGFLLSSIVTLSLSCISYKILPLACELTNDLETLFSSNAVIEVVT